MFSSSVLNLPVFGCLSCKENLNDSSFTEQLFKLAFLPRESFTGPGTSHDPDDLKKDERSALNPASFVISRCRLDDAVGSQGNHDKQATRELIYFEASYKPARASPLLSHSHPPPSCQSLYLSPFSSSLAPPL